MTETKHPGTKDGCGAARGPPESRAVRAGERWRQGWDIWLGGKFAEALGSRTLSDLATLARGELLAVLHPACCGRHRKFQKDQPRLLSVRQAGGARPNAGRRIRGEAKRVQISAMVEPHTLELIDQERGECSRCQYLDWLARRRRRRQSVSYLGGGPTATPSRYTNPLAVLTRRVLQYMQSQSDLAPSI